MAYLIHKADGTAISVADNAIDTDFYNPSGGSTGLGMGIQLVGRNAIDYGAAVAQSFLQITENFSSATGTQPIGAKALQGQLWYDKTLSTLYVRVTPGISGANDLATNWRKIPTLDPVTPGDGDIQVLSGPTRINIYAAGAWQQVFPAIYS
jgi:hypothetical protein